MKKIQLFIYLSLFLVIVLIVTFNIISHKKTTIPDKGSVIPTVPVTQPSVSRKPTPVANDFEDYKKSTTKPSGFDDTDIAPDSPITNVKWEIADSTKVSLGIPANHNEKISPDSKKTAQILSNTLQITSKTDGKKITVNLATNTSQSNFIWISESIILVVEKNKEAPNIDFIYAVNANKGTKNLLIGSFPIPSRLNLDLEPLLNPEEKKVFFKDNSGQYWALLLVY